MKITSSGHDDLGSFEVSIPGRCDSCGIEVDVGLKYSTISLTRGLADRKIKLDTPSLIYKKGKTIGVSCGCYARFHRQVAHIERRPKRNG